ANTSVDYQGLPHLPPRAGPVGTNCNLLWTACALLYERASARSDERGLDVSERPQPAQPGNDRLVAVHLHRPLYIPDAKSGRKEVLDSGSVAAAPRALAVGQVRVCRGRLDCHRGVADPAQRPDAWDAVDDPGAAPDYRGRAGGGAEWIERRTGGLYVDLSRNRPLANRRGVCRD